MRADLIILVADGIWSCYSCSIEVYITVCEVTGLLETKGNLVSFLINNLDVLWIFASYVTMELCWEAVQQEEFYSWLKCITNQIVYYIQEELLVFVSPSFLMQDNLRDSLEVQLHKNFNLEIGIYINVYICDVFLFDRYLNNTFLTISFENIRGNIFIGIDTEYCLLYTILPACCHFIIKLVHSPSISLLSIHFASETMISDITTRKYDNVEQL